MQFHRHSPIVLLTKKRGMNLQMLAKNLGVTRRTLYNWIEDPQTISIKYVIYLAGFFGIPAEKLFYLLMINRSEDKRTEGEKEINLKDL